MGLVLIFVLVLHVPDHFRTSNCVCLATWGTVMAPWQ
jgi:hypothetical protein